MGVLARTEEATEGEIDLGLVVVLMTEVLDVLPDGEVRGVTFVISVLGSGCVLVGVVGSSWRAETETKEEEAELGVNFESGLGPEVIFDSWVGVTLGLTLLATPLLTEPAAVAPPNPTFRLSSLSFWEGVTLLFIVFRLSTLARNETESASGSTLLNVAPAEPVLREGEGVVVVFGRAFWVVAGECGVTRSSTGTSISVNQ